jgi:hypothetical protein
VQFDFERQCNCYNGTFSCYDNVCPVPCPETQPNDGESCLFYDSDSCNYGSFCCPGDGGECVPDKSCYCDGMSSYCYDTFVSIACPSVCPETPPNDMDSCDIDSRYQCNYGDAFTCENYYENSEVLSFDFEKQCTCYNGIFSCETNACPVPCPDDKPESGSSCLPFMSYTCVYDEYCCDGADSEICVPMTECNCEFDFKTDCYEPSINCPSKCPETKPENGQGCDMEQRLICRYNEGICPTSECNCVEGVYVCSEACYSIGRPETIDSYGMTNITEVVTIEDNFPSFGVDSNSKPKKKKMKNKMDKKSKTVSVDKKTKKGKKGKKSKRYRK